MNVLYQRMLRGINNQETHLAGFAIDEETSENLTWKLSINFKIAL
jgi:hypothetical protein